MTVFRNHKAAFAWGFAAISMLFVAAMTYVFLRDGPPEGYSQPFTAALLALFWLFALAGSGYAVSKPCITVSVRPDASVRIVRRYPFGARAFEVAGAQVALARVVTSRDDEGDPYFLVRTELEDGSRLDLFEGHDEAACEAIRARFNAALRHAPPQPPTCAGMTESE